MKLRPFAFIILVLLACHRLERFKPTINNTIYDSVGLLTKQQTDSIFGLIKELNDNVGSEIAVIIIDSLKGQPINEYSIQQAERLGVGRESYKDGILFTASVKERKMRIEVGYGLELIIKDEIASRINRQIIAPKFRNGKYGLGIYLGLDSIKYLIEKKRELVGQYPKL